MFSFRKTFPFKIHKIQVKYSIMLFVCFLDARHFLLNTSSRKGRFIFLKNRTFIYYIYMAVVQQSRILNLYRLSKFFVIRSMFQWSSFVWTQGPSLWIILTSSKGFSNPKTEFFGIIARWTKTKFKIDVFFA